MAIRSLSDIPSTKDPREAERRREAAKAEKLAERVTRIATHKPALTDAVATGDIAKIMSRLTEMQRRFVIEYLVDLDGIAACHRAGYKTKQMSKQAAQLLNTPTVRAAINILKAERAANSDVTSDYVLKKIHRIVEDCGDHEKQTALRGLELLARHLGMFIERTEISGKDGEAIKMEQTKHDADALSGAIAGLVARGRKTSLAVVPDTGTEG